MKKKMKLCYYQKTAFNVWGRSQIIFLKFNLTNCQFYYYRLYLMTYVWEYEELYEYSICPYLVWNSKSNISNATIGHKSGFKVRRCAWHWYYKNLVRKKFILASSFDQDYRYFVPLYHILMYLQVLFEFGVWHLKQ